MYKHLGDYRGDLVALNELYRKAGNVKELFEPVLKGVFPGAWVSNMLVSLDPRTTLSVHTDPPLHAGTYRYHLVLRSNPWSWVWHDGEFDQLHVGGIFVMDPAKQHFSVNAGEEPRVHLVIDMVGHPNLEV